ncbi:MAG TPA: hypothetical protein VHR72_09190, partial [Gemmataceae bacterium]|nr:hypothetical protein [Gemmataceae bacterium]
ERLRAKRDAWALNRLVGLRILQNRPDDANAAFHERVALDKKDATSLEMYHAHQLWEAGLWESILELPADSVDRSRVTHHALALFDLIPLRARLAPDDPVVVEWQIHALDDLRARKKAAELIVKNWTRLSEKFRKNHRGECLRILGAAGRWRDVPKPSEGKDAMWIGFGLVDGGHWKEAVAFLESEESRTLTEHERARLRARERIRAGDFAAAKKEIDLTTVDPDSLVADFVAAGKIVESFETSRTDEVLDQVVAILASRKDEAAIARLLKLTAGREDRDPLTRAKLLALEGKWIEADEIVSKETLRFSKPILRERFSDSFYRIRVKAKRAAETLRDFNDRRDVFVTLADLCVAEKEPAQLEALLRTAGRPSTIDSLRTRTAQYHLLRGDDERFLEETKRILQYHNPFESDEIRALSRLGRGDEALRLANRLLRRSYRRHVVDFLCAQLASKDTRKMIAAVDRFADDEDLVRLAYADAELGPQLQSPAYQEFREKYPEPK